MMRRWLWIFACLAAVYPATSWSHETFLFQHENVLGTSFELRVSAASKDLAEDAERSALAEIDRLSAVLSTYDANSEFSRWQSSAVEFTSISRDLQAVLEACERWQSATRDAFHPGAELLSKRWAEAAGAGRLPERAELTALAATLREPAWQIDTLARQAKRMGRYPLTLNSIGKGYIIDQVCQVVSQHRGVDGVFVKIGGDMRASGAIEQPFAIRDPRAAGDNVSLLTGMRLKNQSLGASGSYYRGYEVAGQKFSHIVDPRTGQPADHAPSVTVIAPFATDAGAIATACSVLTIDESLKLVDSLPRAACLIVDRDGAQHASRDLRRLTGLESSDLDLSVAAKTEGKKKTAMNWNGGFELVVELEIDQPTAVRYRRPYVAVWVEDDAGLPVRTIVLWVQKDYPGPQWVPELRRWNKLDRTRRQSETTNFVETIAEATRKPGSYKFVWDGTDNHGVLLKPGKYTLLIEATREHGTYQLIRKEVMLADQPFRTSLEGNTEIKAASIEYHQRSDARGTEPGK